MTARALLVRHETILFFILAATLALLAPQAEQLLSLDNLLNQGRLAAEIGLLALAMTFIIVSGGIDLSVGSIMGLSAVLLGIAWKGMGLPLPAAIVFALLAGTAAGFVNGLFVTRAGLPPLIVTLATLALYRGIAEGLAQGRSTRGFPDWFLAFGQGELFGAPYQIWLLGGAFLLSAAVLGLTPFGRTIYAIGANETAARFSGLPVARAKLAIYAASGFAAAVAGVLFVSRVSTTRSDMGTGLELDAITAVVLGGTSIFGGRGTIIGTALGVLVIQALKNGLALAGVKGDGTIVAIGLALIGSILVSNLFRRTGDG